MGNNSLIKLNQLISAFAASHEQVKRYYFEAEDNISIITTADQSFPVLYATLVPGSSLGFNQNIFNIRFYCFDIIEKGRDNWLTINSDCHLILNDLYRFLVDGNYPFDVQDTDPVPVEWVNDGTMDYVAGLYIDLQIYADTYNKCYIPLENAVVFSGDTGMFVPQNFLTCDNILDCDDLTDYIQDAVLSGSSSVFSGGTVINNTTFQGDVIIEGTTSGGTAYFDEYFSGGTSLETIITNIAQSVSPTGGTPFDCSDLTGCTIITTLQQDVFELQTGLTEAQGDIITIQGDITALQGLTGDMLTCETVTACTELQNYVSNAIASGSTGSTFNCDDLTGCTVFTDLQQDVFELQTGLTQVENSISSLETNFYMMLNFIDVEQFEYRVPEEFVVLNLENPSGLTVTMQVNSSSYTTGNTISKFDLFTVDVNTAGYVLLNCQRV